MSRLILPGEKRVIPSAAAPPPVQLLVAPHGQAIVLFVKIGEQALPVGMTADQAVAHATAVLDAVQQLRQSQCPTESPATDPPACPPPHDTGTMTGTNGTARPHDSIAQPGGDD